LDATGRIWDPFLTPQDRAHLAMVADRRVGFGHAPALLFIDLYRWAFGDQPRPLLEAVNTWPGSCGLAAWQAVPHLQQLLGVAREVGLPVVHITGLEDSGMLGWGKAAHGGVSHGASTHEQRRSHYDIIPQVAPQSGEVVLRKTKPSAFNGTPLLAHLNYLGVDTLIVGGESTSGCVRASVVTAAAIGSRSSWSRMCVRSASGSACDESVRHASEVRRRALTGGGRRSPAALEGLDGDDRPPSNSLENARSSQMTKAHNVRLTRG
jgi:maleamate amidohydrolase